MIYFKEKPYCLINRAFLCLGSPWDPFHPLRKYLMHIRVNKVAGLRLQVSFAKFLMTPFYRTPPVVASKKQNHTQELVFAIVRYVTVKHIIWKKTFWDRWATAWFLIRSFSSFEPVYSCKICMVIDAVFLTKFN